MVYGNGAGKVGKGGEKSVLVLENVPSKKDPPAKPVSGRIVDSK